MGCGVGGLWGGRVLLGLVKPGFVPRVRDELDLSNFDCSLTSDVTWKSSDLLRGDSCPAMEDLVRHPSPAPPCCLAPARPAGRGNPGRVDGASACGEAHGSTR